jgi:glutamate/tyrosine decarboxylase-like PLP-dependent enzyme
MMTDYFEGVRDWPVFPPHTSAEVEAVFEEALPVQGQAPHSILNEWQERVLPHTTHLGSPRYFGYVNGSGTMIGVLAEALAASVNMNPGGWKPAPAATEIERRTIRWIAEMIGYAPDCGGLITSGGTMANFTAIMTALRNLAPYDTTSHGLQPKTNPVRFKLYMSDHEGHVSIDRVADLMNLGRDSIRLIPSRIDFTMDPDELARALDEDRALGDFPLCVVAQVGSINVGAIDPLDRIADICQERGVWLHADGACGAVGAMLPEMAEAYVGLDRADSITLDPHKWLYIPYECGCLLVRDKEKLRRAFSMTAPYLRGTLPTEYAGLDYFEYGPQMSRGFKALKLWMTLKHFGVEGYRTLLRQNIQCARYLDELVRESDDFEALHTPILYIYSFRYSPPEMEPDPSASAAERGQAEERLDELNQSIADAIQLSGEAFIMTSQVRDRVVLRLSICSHRTRLQDIKRVFETLRELGEQLRN